MKPLYTDRIKNYKLFLMNNCVTAWADHLFFVAEAVRHFEPQVIVDLGVDEGYSSFAFGTHNIGKIYGIDSFAGDEHIGEKSTYDKVMNVYSQIQADYGVNNIEFIKGFFNDVDHTWDKKIDFIHIDGLHTYDAVSEDFNTWSPFCTSNTVFFFHDVMSFPYTVGRFFEGLEGYKFIRPQSNGLGVYSQNYAIINALNNISQIIEG